MAEAGLLISLSFARTGRVFKHLTITAQHLCRFRVFMPGRLGL